LLKKKRERKVYPWCVYQRSGCINERGICGMDESISSFTLSNSPGERQNLRNFLRKIQEKFPFNVAENVICPLRGLSLAGVFDRLVLGSPRQAARLVQSGPLRPGSGAKAVVVSLVSLARPGFCERHGRTGLPLPLLLHRG
jgi:hypothetical protein